MKILLDTDICIYGINRRNPQPLERLRSYAIGEVGISAITYAELHFGVVNSARAAENLERLERFLLAIMGSLKSFNFGEKVRMSYMSLFEKSARNSAAVSLLNKMRHWLQGRQQEGLSTEEKQVLQEALNIMESKQFEQMVIHSFQGVSSGLASSVLPISMALRVATDNNNLKTSGLKKLLSSEDLPEDKSERDSYVELLNQAIQTIGNLDLEVGHNRIIKSQYKGL